MHCGPEVCLIKILTTSHILNAYPENNFTHSLRQDVLVLALKRIIILSLFIEQKVKVLNVSLLRNKALAISYPGVEGGSLLHYLSSHRIIRT